MTSPPLASTSKHPVAEGSGASSSSGNGIGLGNGGQRGREGRAVQRPKVLFMGPRRSVPTRARQASVAVRRCATGGLCAAVHESGPWWAARSAVAKWGRAGQHQGAGGARRNSPRNEC